jgi:hypothetical protein
LGFVLDRRTVGSTQHAAGRDLFEWERRTKKDEAESHRDERGGRAGSLAGGNLVGETQSFVTEVLPALKDRRAEKIYSIYVKPKKKKAAADWFPVWTRIQTRARIDGLTQGGESKVQFQSNGITIVTLALFPVPRVAAS